MLKTSVVLFCLFLSVLLKAQEAEFPDRNELTSKEFLSVMRDFDNVTIIDVRTKNNKHREFIDGAVFAPEKEVLNMIIDTLDKDNPVLFYCTYGERSLAAAKYIEEKGFKRVYSLKEGFLEWKRKKLPVKKKRVRVML